MGSSKLKTFSYCSATSNGAGKTSTINMLTGLSRITSGNIRIKGIDTGREMKKVQQFIGIVPGESNLYPELSDFENLCFCASLYGVKKKEREREMIFLCGLFIPLETLPVVIRPLAYVLPLTYGADVLKYAISGANLFSPWLSIILLIIFAAGLFVYSIMSVREKWIK